MYPDQYRVAGPDEVRPAHLTSRILAALEDMRFARRKRVWCNLPACMRLDAKVHNWMRYHPRKELDPPSVAAALLAYSPAGLDRFLRNPRRTLARLVEEHCKRLEAQSFPLAEHIFTDEAGKVWYLARLTHDRDIKYEGTVLGHCLRGSGRRGTYVSAVNCGRLELYSLREMATHRSRATISFDPTARKIQQVSGPRNLPPARMDARLARAVRWAVATLCVRNLTVVKAPEIARELNRPALRILIALRRRAGL